MKHTLPILDSFPQMLDEKRTARILACSVAALRRWRCEGRGPQFTRVERCVRYSLQEIEDYLAKNASHNKKAADSQSAAKREARDGYAATRQT
jgi:hypothetical protein